jgi:hypothetical protein
VAKGCIDHQGREVSAGSPDSLIVFVVSVHEQYPTDEVAREQLLSEVRERQRHLVSSGMASLWVFPAGYFGFNAFAARGGEREVWPGFNGVRLRSRLSEILATYPQHAWLAFGADAPRDGDSNSQQVWVCHTDSAGETEVRVITRGQTAIPERTIQVGPVRAAFFDCGEFTGSRTGENGPFCDYEYLDDVSAQLADCRLLVDLAHSRVSGTVGGVPGPRRVHEAQMRRFADHGAAVLTHHHAGFLSGGRPRSDSQSNWIMFRGGSWLDSSQVISIP